MIGSVTEPPGESTGELPVLAERPVLVDLPVSAERSKPSGPPEEPGPAPRRALTRATDSILARLLDLLVDAGSEHDLLPGLCELAVETVPGCAGATVTMLDGEPFTAAVSDRRYLEVERAQHRAGDGPSLRAVRADTETVFALAELDGAGSDAGWLGAARDLGVSAVLSAPLPSTARIRAALTLYSARPGGWPDGALEAADLLATYAGDALTVAARLTRP
jgi:hypothetical protein